MFLVCYSDLALMLLERGTQVDQSAIFCWV
jgi:transposase-like protein